ncbi:MAG TPA: HEAT repeat domain-containing protein [Kofleriaceae bacterium]|jgi:hypothetical protein|nr:HEAT repeat domain-containing protein [Kofleriaceae bacterium]
MRWAPGLIVAAIVVLGPGTARADAIDVDVKHLRTSPDFKLRLSSALNLSRVKDERAVDAMAWALQKDDQVTIRRVAALSLTRMVDESLPASVRRRALAALKWAKLNDDDAKVRENAARALDQLRGLETAADAKVFLRVVVNPDPRNRAPRGTTDRMRQTLQETLRRAAPEWAQGTDDDLPTKAQLDKNGTKAFIVGAAVANVEVNHSGTRTEIRCSVSVRVAPWQGADGNEVWQADKAASASGNGKVVGASTPTAIDGSKRDCLLAVAEQITARQVVPFLRKMTN